MCINKFEDRTFSQCCFKEIRLIYFYVKKTVQSNIRRMSYIRLKIEKYLILLELYILRLFTIYVSGERRI